jgi:rhamnogalacturonyl hydrolase YesR
MQTLRFLLLGCLIVAPLIAAEAVPPPAPAMQEAKPARLIPGPVVAVRDRGEISSLMKRVADWQLAEPDKRHFSHWARAVGHLGLLAATRATGDEKYERALIDLCEANQWKLGPALYHADDQVTAQSYLELYRKFKDARMIAPLQAGFDRILAEPSKSGLAYGGWKNSDRWCWCDALFMAPSVWGELALVTGKREYLDFMVSEWVAFDDFLYDAEERLYFRDSRFFSEREKNGRKIFWSRGNGWVLGAYARMLPFLPEDHPQRARIVARFREFAARVIALQPADGLWRASLPDTETFDLGETSGTALFCYGLAWGINQGLLDRATFAPAAFRAWDALAAHVQPDGLLIQVQRVADRPGRFDPNKGEVYASGAFLLAGEQILRLAEEPAAAR